MNPKFVRKAYCYNQHNLFDFLSKFKNSENLADFVEKAVELTFKLLLD